MCFTTISGFRGWSFGVPASRVLPSTSRSHFGLAPASRSFGVPAPPEVRSFAVNRLPLWATGSFAVTIASFSTVLTAVVAVEVVPSESVTLRVRVNRPSVFGRPPTWPVLAFTPTPSGRSTPLHV